jgi:hypothetical protein
VDQTGKLTEKICTDKYDRQIDTSGNLTETVKGNLTLHSDGKMLLETKNSDITLDSGTANITLRCNKRIEETQKEYERMDWGFKSEIAAGHVHEFIGGFKDEIMLGGKFESINALAISLALAGNFGFNLGVELQGSLVNIIYNEISLKKKQADIENSGVAVTVQNAIKMVL